MRPTRKSTGSYDLKIDCLFCGTPVDWSRKHCRWNEPIQVRTIEFTDNVKKGCKKRCDEWSYIVLGRVESILSDLHAADCVYHRSCSVNFQNGKQILQVYETDPVLCKKWKIGRPENEEQRLAFLLTCSYLEENDDAQLTLSDLVKDMNKNLANN